MIFRQLDANGDWTFGKGIANYAQNELALNLNISTTVKSWKGDCFFALQFGVDWKRFLDTGQQKNLQAGLQNAIAQCYGVVGVTAASAQFDPVTRKLSSQYKITTIFSPSYVRQISILTGNTGS